MHLIDKRSSRHPNARTPDELEAPEAGNKVYYDTDHKHAVSGFGLRITSAGAKSFVLNYRINGRERRFTIGKYPDYSVTAAREVAKKLKQKIKAGDDPLARLQADREAPTVADLCQRYIEEALPDKRPSTQRDDKSMIDRDILPKLKHLKVSEVAHVDIDKLHRKISERAPYRANRVVALLSNMFALAIKRWKWRDRQDGNPCEDIKRNPEDKRKRYIKADELARLMAALDEFPDTEAATIIRLLLLTGARSGEVMGARWDQFDLEAGVWVKPGATTKQKTEHEVPLSPAALDLLRELREQADDEAEYLFPGDGGTGHRADHLKRPWPEICKAANITGLRVHDLRHSYASFLVSDGKSLPTIGALLGHTQASTTQRYAHLHDDALRKATTGVGKRVMGAKRSAKVVKLPLMAK